MSEKEGRVICVWGGRHSLKINSGEVHECPLRSRSSDGTIPLSDCKYCSSHVKVVKE